MTCACSAHNISLRAQINPAHGALEFCPFAALPQAKIEELLLHWARSGEHSPHGVHMLVEDPRIPLAVANRALRLAAARGDAKIIQQLVRRSPQEEPCASALRLAAKNGHFEVIKHLLIFRHPHIAIIQKTLHFTQNNNQTTIVEALTEELRIA